MPWRFQFVNEGYRVALHGDPAFAISANQQVIVPQPKPAGALTGREFGGG